MITIGEGVLSLKDFSGIVFNKKIIHLSEAGLNRMTNSFEFLQKFSSNKLIYGINTGLGPMAQIRIGEQDLLPLQYNLIRSHSSGSGTLLPPDLVKALMLARLNSLIQGYSGIHIDVVELIKVLINNNITPCIYEHGGVGASGDLVQLAHLALVLIGEGEVLFEDDRYRTQEIFKRLAIQPISIHIREGLSILNGTSAMTGIGMVNIILAQKLFGWSAMLSALTNEVVEAYDDHFSKELNMVKHHYGQNMVASMLRNILKGSQMIRKRPDHLYHPVNLDQEIFEDKIQEYYSLRCITQVLGPIYDTILQSENVVVNELNSVNDNPVIDHENKNIFHGGNFHGDYVSLEMDKLKIAITKLSMLSERQLNYLLNDKLNKKFPPFLNLGVLGLNFGMQGVQFTATSTVAENQTLSFPMYVHSIPNNNDNQDIVSMGCNAAMMTRRVIANSFEVLSIHLMGILQAIDYLGCQEKLAPMTRTVYTDLRKIFPKFVEDQPKYKDIENIKGFMENADLIIPF
ncbi:MAG: HAL/PAL/TAL family ammonia-lyase [Chitinophagaceae bacterium]